MSRYYRVEVQRNLFGRFVTIREWRRIGSSGQVKTDWHDTQKAADDAAASLIMQKESRGYTRAA